MFNLNLPAFLVEMSKYQAGKIYQVVNILNDFVYVGSTVQSLSNRMSEHRQTARAGPKPHENPMYAVMRANPKAFSIVLIEEYACNKRTELERREYEIMQTKFDRSKLYNIQQTVARSESTKAKLSAACKDHARRRKAAVLTPEDLDRIFAAEQENTQDERGRSVEPAVLQSADGSELDTEPQKCC